MLRCVVERTVQSVWKRHPRSAEVLPYRPVRWRRRATGRSLPVGALLFLAVGIGGFLATEIGSGQAADVAGHARVRDGDTIVVGDTPVRLKGLHCPELGKAGGAEASNVMSRMVAGRQVSCTLTGERTYDRIVGRCSVDGADLGVALIRGGVCARCPRYDPLMLYLPAQLEAGRWRGSMPGYC